MHALAHVDTAAERLLAPGAVVVPAKVTVRAQLIQFRMSYHSGLDLSALNTYRWHPYAEQVRKSTAHPYDDTRHTHVGWVGSELGWPSPTPCALCMPLERHMQRSTLRSSGPRRFGVPSAGREVARVASALSPNSIP